MTRGDDEPQKSLPPNSLSASLYKNTLLKSKYAVPSLPPFTVERTAAQLRLEAALAAPIVLVQAPTGYGKSIEVIRYMQRKKLPVAWVTLDEADQDPRRLWGYLAAALDDVLPGSVMANFLPWLQRDPLQMSEMLLVTLSNTLDQAPQNLVIVLKNYQTLPGEKHNIHDAITHFAEHLPSTVHLLLISREEPPLPLGRWRAEGRLRRIGVESLAFDADHAREQLNLMHLVATDEPLSHLEGAVEGWAAAWQLAFALLEARTPIERVVAAFEGTPRTVVDFITAEILPTLPSPTLHFLQHIAYLERFSVELSDVVTASTQSEAFIEQLIRAQLFISPLDKGEQWHRLAHLFRAALTRQMPLDPVARRLLYQRASRWCLDHHYELEAVKYAVRSEDEAFLIATVEQEIPHQIVLLRAEMVRMWLASFATTVIDAHPMLLLGQAFVALGSYHMDVAATALEHLERRAAAEITSRWPLPGMIAMLRAFQAQLLEDKEQWRQSIEAARRGIPPEHPFGVLVTLSEGILAQSLGNFETAREIWQDLGAMLDPERNPALAYVQLTHLAATLWQLGENQEAQRLYAHVDVLADPPIGPLLTIPHLLDRALQSYMRNDLDQAKQYYQEVVDGAIIPLAKADGRLKLAAVLLAQGQKTAAQHASSGIFPMSQTTAQDYLLLMQSHQYQIWSQLGQTEAADAGLETLEKHVINLPITTDTRAIIRCSLAAWAFRRQRWPEALAHLAAVRLALQHHRWILVDLVASLTEALIKDLMGDEPEAFELLHHAFALRLRDDYIRYYWDCGPNLGDLLRRWQAANQLSAEIVEFIKRLQQGYTDQDTLTELVPVPPTNPPLPGAPAIVQIADDLPDNVHLSRREGQILAYVMQGATNDEIAELLGIASGTVKRHISNIFPKLPARNRAEAITRAHTLWGLHPQAPPWGNDWHASTP